MEPEDIIEIAVPGKGLIAIKEKDWPNHERRGAMRFEDYKKNGGFPKDEESEPEPITATEPTETAELPHGDEPEDE